MLKEGVIVLKDKLKIEVERYNELKEDQFKAQEYLKNIEKDILIVQGRISMLNELLEFVANQEIQAVKNAELEKQKDVPLELKEDK